MRRGERIYPGGETATRHITTTTVPHGPRTKAENTNSDTHALDLDFETLPTP